MYGYIYKTTNLVNGKIYVGQKKSTRFLKNKYLGSGVYFKNAVKKFGKDVFNVELLEECSNQDELDLKEQKWIKELDAQNTKIGYNISIGGQHKAFMTGLHHSEEVRKKLSERGRNSRIVNNGIQNKVIKVNELKYYLEQGWKRGYIENINKRYVNDGDVCFKIYESELEYYLSQGFKQGFLPYIRSESFKQKIAEGNRNKCCIHKGDKQTRVLKTELDSYLNDGWELGWVKKEKALIVKPGEGKMKYMFNPSLNEFEKVYESNWNSYLENGWIFKGPSHSEYEHKKGYKMSEQAKKNLSKAHLGEKHPQDRIERHRQKLKGRVYMNKDGIKKLIPLGEEQIYLQQGWKLGKI